MSMGFLIQDQQTLDSKRTSSSHDYLSHEFGSTTGLDAAVFVFIAFTKTVNGSALSGGGGGGLYAYQVTGTRTGWTRGQDRI